MTESSTEVRCLRRRGARQGCGKGGACLGPKDYGTDTQG